MKWHLKYFLTDPQAFCECHQRNTSGSPVEGPCKSSNFIYAEAVRCGQAGAMRAGGGPEQPGPEISSQWGLPGAMQPPLKPEHGGYYSDILEQ